MRVSRQITRRVKNGTVLIKSHVLLRRRSFVVVRDAHTAVGKRRFALSHWLLTAKRIRYFAKSYESKRKSTSAFQQTCSSGPRSFKDTFRVTGKKKKIESKTQFRTQFRDSRFRVRLGEGFAPRRRSPCVPAARRYIACSHARYKLPRRRKANRRPCGPQGSWRGRWKRGELCHFYQSYACSNRAQYARTSHYNATLDRPIAFIFTFFFLSLFS